MENGAICLDLNNTAGLKAITGPLWGESTSYWYILLTNGQ